MSTLFPAYAFGARYDLPIPLLLFVVGGVAVVVVSFLLVRPRAVRAPWLVAMVAYTAFSLLLIAQPLVQESNADQGAALAPQSQVTQQPAAAGDSPWKTHDDSGTGAHSHSNTADMPGMDHGDTAGAAKDRPLAPVLGTFGGATSAALLTAGFLRRRDRARAQAKQAARAARGTQK